MELKVAYKSQFDPDAQKAKGDCVETAFAMLANYVLNANFTTDQIVDLCGSNLASTTMAEIRKAAEAVGLPLNYYYNCNWDDVGKWLNEGKPIMAYLNYEEIKTRQDVNYKGCHCVLIVGNNDNIYAVNDPDRWGDQKRTIPIGRDEFERAWNTTQAKGMGRNGMALVPTKGRLPAPPPPPADPCKSVKDELAVANRELQTRTKEVETERVAKESFSTRLGDLQKEIEAERKENKKLMDNMTQTLTDQEKEIEELEKKVKSLEEGKGLPLDALRSILSDFLGRVVEKIREIFRRENGK